MFAINNHWFQLGNSYKSQVHYNFILITAINKTISKGLNSLNIDDKNNFLIAY